MISSMLGSIIGGIIGVIIGNIIWEKEKIKEIEQYENEQEWEDIE